MNRRNGIDLFRLIASFFIICLHTSYGTLNQEYVDNLRLLSRWALPFFFIATGFFLANKIENNTLNFKRIQKNISMLISILIISSIVYLPIAIIKHDAPNSISNILTGSFFHLWFIGSLLMGYIFIWYLFFIKKSNLLSYISIGILLLTLYVSYYGQLINKSLNYEFFRFLLSIPFMNIGIILAKKENNLNSFSKKLLIGLVLIGIVIQLLEAELLLKWFNYNKHSHQLLFGTLVMAVSLFVLSIKINLKENILSKWGREHSLLIYLYHPLILINIWEILKFVPNYSNSVTLFLPLIGFTLTFAFSIILSRFFPEIFNIMSGKCK